LHRARAGPGAQRRRADQGRRHHRAAERRLHGDHPRRHRPRPDQRREGHRPEPVGRLQGQQGVGGDDQRRQVRRQLVELEQHHHDHVPVTAGGSRRTAGRQGPAAPRRRSGRSEGGAAAPLAGWYAERGRHDLPWRASRDRWAVLVSEVMLQQTQAGRVAAVWPGFMARFPTPEAMAAVPAGDVIAAWGTLGYPRRARRLWEAAGRIAAGGWPHDLADLPGVGRYTADAVAAQADGHDTAAIETNIRRVVERHAGRRLTPAEAAAASRAAGRPLTGRDRLLALMDVGAVLCRPAAPRCPDCPLEPGCATAASIATGEAGPAPSPSPGGPVRGPGPAPSPSPGGPVRGPGPAPSPSPGGPVRGPGPAAAVPWREL